MKKEDRLIIELIEKYRKKQRSFTQLQLSSDKELNISIGMVNKIINKLEKIGIIRLKQRSFEIIDIAKLINYLCVKRELNKDIFESFYVDLPVKKIENSMPNNITYTAYSAYRLSFDESPADYSEIYVYSSESLKKRFSKHIKNINKNNVFVLKKNFEMEKIAPVSLIYADLWNLKEWYAKEFLSSLRKRLKNEGILE
ncbi:winged helix-turn-helix domain-containing protein [Candidatus Woesearchaeota archaeon]|nr:winged helix-turn-helix domain-containing protein [Candidatus Woesearchaeota archaeon]